MDLLLGLSQLLGEVLHVFFQLHQLFDIVRDILDLGLLSFEQIKQGLSLFTATLGNQVDQILLQNLVFFKQIVKQVSTLDLEEGNLNASRNKPLQLHRLLLHLSHFGLDVTNLSGVLHLHFHL